MNQNRAFSWKKKKVITGRENFLVNRKKFVRYSYLPEKDCWGRLVKGSWSKRRLRQHQYFGWSHDQIFHHWATRHSNVPGLWKVCFLFMKWVRRICGRGWRTSTLMWAWDLPDRCLRQKNFRREFPWRLRIWNLIPLTHQCLNTLESADIMLWGTHALIYFYFIKKIYWCTVDWPTYQFRRHKRWGFSSWVGKIPWRRKWQPLQYACLGNPRGQRSLAGYSPRGHRESDMTQRLKTHTYMGDWQCCVTFRCTTKWFTRTYPCVPFSPPNSLPD